MTLREYVTAHTQRGACTCGRCADAPDDPKDHQPDAALHTADLMFFKVALVGTPDRAALKALVQAECPQLLDGREHGYIEVGGAVGDQGDALVLMGLGALLGLWTLLTPRTVLGSLHLPEAALMDIAGQGLVTIRASQDRP